MLSQVEYEQCLKGAQDETVHGEISLTYCRISCSSRSFRGNSAPSAFPGVLFTCHVLSIFLASASMWCVLGRDFCTCVSSWYASKEIENLSMIKRIALIFSEASSSRLLQGWLCSWLCWPSREWKSVTSRMRHGSFITKVSMFRKMGCCFPKCPSPVIVVLYLAAVRVTWSLAKR